VAREKKRHVTRKGERPLQKVVREPATVYEKTRDKPDLGRITKRPKNRTWEEKWHGERNFTMQRFLVSERVSNEDANGEKFWGFTEAQGPAGEIAKVGYITSLLAECQGRGGGQTLVQSIVKSWTRVQIKEGKHACATGGAPLRGGGMRNIKERPLKKKIHMEKTRERRKTTQRI